MTKMSCHMLLCQKSLVVLRSSAYFPSARSLSLSSRLLRKLQPTAAPTAPETLHALLQTPPSSQTIHPTPPTSLPHIRSERRAILFTPDYAY